MENDFERKTSRKMTETVQETAPLFQTETWRNASNREKTQRMQRIVLFGSLRFLRSVAAICRLSWEFLCFPRLSTSRVPRCTPKNALLSTPFCDFFTWIRLATNCFRLKHYRKFFLFFAPCLDARHEIKNRKLVQTGGEKFHRGTAVHGCDLSL